MELVKQNIHMDRVGREGATQITLEDDMNLPETKPDIGSLCMEKGNVVIEEVRPAADMVSVRGRLSFSVLYYTQEEGGRLVCTEGKILFDEKIRVEGVTASDSVTVCGEAEDLTIGIINSRKLSVQSVISLTAAVEDIYDEEIPVGVSEADGSTAKPQYRQVPVELSQVMLCKKDVVRIREEMTIPSGFPNVGQIIWKNAELGELNFRLGMERLQVKGEIKVFALYEADGDRAARVYETVIPISAEIACSGCREDMAADVRFALGQWELAERADEDGEQRIIGLEASLDLRICVYEEKTVDLITDIYGVKREISCEKKNATLQKLLRCVVGRCKFGERVPLKSGGALLQILHSEGKVCLIATDAVNDGIRLRGSLFVKILCITGEDDKPYDCVRARIPFEYLLEVPGFSEKDIPGSIQIGLEELSVTVSDAEAADVKAVVSFATTALRRESVEMIDCIRQEPLDSEKMAALPSMVIYVVKPGDNLWNIGKKYYVPVQSLVDLNELSTQELTPGQKLLIVKGI